MMNQSRTLSTASFEHSSMDYAFLRGEGIRHLERMAGDLWTDFNAHDPGITILEQVCYALTDLAYRIDYALPDLLSEEGGDPYDSLYSPAQILTSHPVTLIDLRKLVIDVDGVKNAWVEKVAEPDISLYFSAAEKTLSLQGDDPAAEPVYLKGLYRVLVEKSDLMDIDGTVVQREVARRLHANRNLGEDFEDIRVLESQEIQVQARVEIGQVEHAEDVLLEVFQRIAEYISPLIPFYTLSQLLEAGKRVDEVFDGPVLEHGFVDSEALRRGERRTVLYTSDLIREIMDVSGVRAVRVISISAGGAPEQWALKLDPDRAPKLDLRESDIRLEKNRLAASADVEAVIETYYQRLRDTTTFRKLAAEERDLQPPSGRDRKVGRYHSLQHQFPPTYGIGAMGLPDSATPLRKARAKQLKAYLMFFDQLLANYFAQLTHVKDLFSFASDSPSGTYFSRMIDDPALGLEEIRLRDPAEHRSRLQQITENPGGAQAGTSPPGSDRRSRFLNHLLARFAERFTDYSLILYGLMPRGSTLAAEKLVRDKQAFLQHYPQISSARGTAFNCLMPRDGDNVSGLEKRIRFKLGFEDRAEEYFYLVEHILLRPMEGDDQQQIPLLADPRHRDPFSLQLSFVFPAWPERFDDSDFRQFVERTVWEETPAHLTSYIHWLGKDEMTTFESAYGEWLDRRRAYWTDKFGV